MKKAQTEVETKPPTSAEIAGKIETLRSQLAKEQLAKTNAAAAGDRDDFHAAETRCIEIQRDVDFLSPQLEAARGRQRAVVDEQRAAAERERLRKVDSAKRELLMAATAFDDALARLVDLAKPIDEQRRALHALGETAGFSKATENLLTRAAQTAGLGAFVKLDITHANRSGSLVQQIGTIYGPPSAV